MLDLFLVYQFLRRLATPFEEWEAFKLGIIDEKGNVLRKRRTLGRNEEKKAFGVYDVMVLNLKKLIAKAPGGETKLASYAAALFLIREWNHFSADSMLTEDLSDSDVLLSLHEFTSSYLTEEVLTEARLLLEDAPTVSAGSGAIAGIGIGDQGEPGFTPEHIRKHKKRILKRKELEDHEYYE